MTKKYNGYFLCILLMLLISIACMLVVFNVQVEAEGEIQYNLTLYYSEEDVGTSYLFAEGTQISLPNDLSDYDENYNPATLYTFGFTINIGTSTTLTIEWYISSNCEGSPVYTDTLFVM